MIGIIHAGPLPRVARRSLRTAALALVVAGALLATRALPAHAGGTLSVPANPVVIPAGQTTATTALSWNLNGATQKAMLEVKDTSNGSTVASTVVGTPTGSISVPVTLGKSYLATLSDVTRKGLLTSLTITTAGGDAGNPGGEHQGCAASCIVDVTKQAHGTWVRFHLVTSVPAQYVVEVGDAPPAADGTFAKVVASGKSAGQKISGDVDVVGLNPNTQYYFVARATDANGSSFKTSSLTTLQRTTTITFTEIFMDDDSDDLGDCECGFTFSVNGAEPEFFVDEDFPTGKPRNPNAQFTFQNGGHFNIHVIGYDTDSDFCGSLKLDKLQSGTDDCGEWTVVFGSHSVTKTGPGEAYTQGFTLTAVGSNGSTLDYTIKGTIQVSYTP